MGATLFIASILVGVCVFVCSFWLSVAFEGLVSVCVCIFGQLSAFDPWHLFLNTAVRFANVVTTAVERVSAGCPRHKKSIKMPIVFSLNILKTEPCFRCLSAPIY
ncbi:MAG: hypothetical protein RBQ94_05125 [Methanimicrococcus sp.]|nr:hypothetical protein [Methanimicrococcus sp.]